MLVIDLERILDDVPEVIQVERLGNEIEGAELQGLHRRLDVAVRRDHGHRHAGRVHLHPLDELESVAVRQPHVRQAQVEFLRSEQVLGAADIAR